MPNCCTNHIQWMISVVWSNPNGYTISGLHHMIPTFKVFKMNMHVVLTWRENSFVMLSIPFSSSFKLIEAVSLVNKVDFTLMCNVRLMIDRPAKRSSYRTVCKLPSCQFTNRSPKN